MCAEEYVAGIILYGRDATFLGGKLASLFSVNMP